MKSSYITYFEGYNKDGNVIFNGNGAACVEHGGFIDPNELLNSHITANLELAKKHNPLVVRIVIKSLTKL